MKRTSRYTPLRSVTRSDEVCVPSVRVTFCNAVEKCYIENY
ncbi:hypothetical protein [Avrilella dinanensis]|nr:hypothetical protein [Avrilella dinanensis]